MTTHLNLFLELAHAGDVFSAGCRMVGKLGYQVGLALELFLSFLTSCFSHSTHNSRGFNSLISPFLKFSCSLWLLGATLVFFPGLIFITVYDQLVYADQSMIVGLSSPSPKVRALVGQLRSIGQFDPFQVPLFIYLFIIFRVLKGLIGRGNGTMLGRLAQAAMGLAHPYQHRVVQQQR